MKLVLVSALVLVLAASACAKSAASERAAPAASPVASMAASPSAGAALVRVKIPVEGMNCAKCAANIAGALKRIDGVQDAAVSYEEKLVVVTYDENKVTTDRLVAEIDKLGFKAGTPVKG